MLNSSHFGERFPKATAQSLALGACSKAILIHEYFPRTLFGRSIVIHGPSPVMQSQ